MRVATGRRAHLRLSTRLVGTFLLIVGVLAGAGMMVTIRTTVQRLEARVESQLATHETLVKRDLVEIEEKITRFGQLAADTEMLTEQLAPPSVSRSLMISLVSDLRRHGMKIELFSEDPPTSRPNSALIRKGFLGIRSVSLTTAPPEGKVAAAIEGVSPIETTEGIRRVVVVSFPLTATYLSEIGRRIGAEITLILPNGAPLSTLPAEDLASLVGEVRSRALTRELEGPVMLDAEARGEPAKTLVSSFRVSLKPEGLLLITMPMGDLLAAKRSILFKGFLITAAIVSVATLLYLSLIRRITKPLEELSRATRDIAAGNLDRRVSVATGDEVGDLARSFNAMVQRLKVSRDEIEGWSQALERRVEERTRSLQEARAELEALNDQLVRALKELREAEEQKIHNERLAAMGQMASTMAHEIRNPLAGMRAALEVVTSGLRDPEHVDVLNEVVDQIDRLTLTTTRLLSFARPATPERKPTRVGELVEKTRLLIEDRARRRGVETHLDLESPDRWVDLDPQLTTQAFLNIALNALQAMEGKGVLTIRTRYSPDEDAMRVTFADTGQGMPEEVQRKAFTPFFTTKSDGTGLGLYVVRDVIVRQGGSVSLESRPGEGTVVTVRLPAGHGSAVAAAG